MPKERRCRLGHAHSLALMTTTVENATRLAPQIVIEVRSTMEGRVAHATKVIANDACLNSGAQLARINARPRASGENAGNGTVIVNMVATQASGEQVVRRSVRNSVTSHKAVSGMMVIRRPVMRSTFLLMTSTEAVFARSARHVVRVASVATRVSAQMAASRASMERLASRNATQAVTMLAVIGTLVNAKRVSMGSLEVTVQKSVTVIVPLAFSSVVAVHSGFLMQGEHRRRIVSRARKLKPLSWSQTLRMEKSVDASEALNALGMDLASVSALNPLTLSGKRISRRTLRNAMYAAKRTTTASHSDQ